MSRLSMGLAVAAALTVGGLAASTAPAAAAPFLDPGVATAADVAGAKPEQVRWVCNAWGRCWWRPNYYGPRVYGWGGPIYRPWGWRRGWGYRRWRRW